MKQKPILVKRIYQLSCEYRLDYAIVDDKRVTEHKVRLPYDGRGEHLVPRDLPEIIILQISKGEANIYGKREQEEQRYTANRDFHSLSNIWAPTIGFPNITGRRKIPTWRGIPVRKETHSGKDKIIYAEDIDEVLKILKANNNVDHQNLTLHKRMELFTLETVLGNMQYLPKFVRRVLGI